MSLRSADHETVTLLDGLVGFWAVLWLALALFTGQALWSFTQLADTGVRSAEAIDQAGAAVQQLREIPLVGEGPGQLGDRIRATASDLEASSEATRGDIRRTALLVGFAVLVIPVAPVLAVYGPLRLSHRRELAGLRRSLGRPNQQAAVDAYLAHQALSTLTLDQLQEVADDPARDWREGRHDALAALQLRRLGLAVPPRLRASGGAR